MRATHEDAGRAARLAEFTIERAADAVFWVGADARIRRANEAACRLLGYTRDELRSMTVCDINPEMSSDQWPQRWADLKTCKARTFETNLRTKDRRMIPVEVSGNYIAFDGQEYTCSFARPIVERKQAEEQIASLAKFPEEDPNPVLRVARDGRVLYHNEASACLLRAWGCQTVQGLVGPWHEVVLEVLHAGRPRQVETACSDRIYVLTFAPIAGTDYLNVYAQDVTELRSVQAKLDEEAKLAEVARVLGDIGHDIKNMLMPIVTGAGLLRDELDEHFGRLPDPEAAKAKGSREMSLEIIEMIQNSARRIHGLVKEMADSVKGLSAPPQFAPCQVADVVRTVFETLRVLADEKGISLRARGLADLPAIQADENRLFNAFYNLVNNAIPEVPPGGSVTVRGRAEPGTGMVALSVVDTGRGMPPEVRDSLFTSRVVSLKAGGTGLGTKIIKDVVDAHGGRITVESQPGAGTAFHLWLPIEGPSRPPQSPSGSHAEA